MRAKLWTALTICLPLAIAASTASSADYATKEEAKALLERALTDVKADQSAALAKFNTGEDGYKDRDLYIFCFDATTGIMNAHPTLMGADIRTIKDKTGATFGEKMFAGATEGTMSEVAYFWPRPGETEPVQKRSFYAKVGNEVCGTGYYE